MGGDCTLECSMLPSSNRGVPFRSWTLNRQSYEIIEYAVDHGQDLLVLIEETLVSLPTIERVKC